jgi:hypothetical protein
MSQMTSCPAFASGRISASLVPLAKDRETEDKTRKTRTIVGRIFLMISSLGTDLHLFSYVSAD